MKIGFYVTSSSVNTKARQLNIPHDQAVQLLREAKLPADTKIGRKSGVNLELTLALKNGPVTLRMGDTHAVWQPHQGGGKGEEFINRLYEAAATKLGENRDDDGLCVDGTINLPEVEVSAVKAIGAAKGKGGTGATGKVDVSLDF